MAEKKKSIKPEGHIATQRPKYINVYLGLGSNQGDRRELLRTASELIHKHIGKIARKSRLYETQPWGVKGQDWYLNQVIMINSILEPRDILEVITKIERELGRERKEKYGPRPIDIDILFYGKRIIRDKGLEIPHPEIPNRAFVIVPLMEMSPELEHPVSGLTMDQLYVECTDTSQVVMLDV